MFPSQSAPLLGSAEQQRCWFGLTCGHSGLNLVSRGACASCCVLLPASLYSPIPSGWAPEMTLGWDQSRGSHVVTHNAGKCLDVLLGLLFLTEKQKTGRRPLYVVLHWPEGGAVWSARSPFSHPPSAACLGLCSMDAKSPHPRSPSGVVTPSKNFNN